MDFFKLNKSLADISDLQGTERMLLIAMMDEKPRTMGEAAEEITRTRAAMTSITDTLESEGLLRREHDVADRRRVFIKITPKAKKLLERAARRA